MTSGGSGQSGGFAVAARLPGEAEVMWRQVTAALIPRASTPRRNKTQRSQGDDTAAL